MENKGNKDVNNITIIDNNEVTNSDYIELKNILISKIDGKIVLNVTDKKSKNIQQNDMAFKNIIGKNIADKTLKELGFLSNDLDISSYRIESLQNEAEVREGCKVIFDLILGLRQEGTIGRLEKFCIIEYDEACNQQAITNYGLHIEGVFNQYFISPFRAPGIQLIGIFGPKVKKLGEIDFSYNLKYKPIFIYLSEYTDKIVFPALDELKAQNEKGTRLDLLKLLHLPRIGKFDVEIFKKSCIYGLDSSLFDSELSYRFLQVLKFLYPKKDQLSILEKFERRPHVRDIIAENEEKLVQKGILKGFAIGKEEGKEEGKKIGLIESVMALLRHGVSRDVIKKSLKLTEKKLRSIEANL